MKLETITPFVAHAARSAGQALQAGRSDEIARAVAPLGERVAGADLFSTAWKAAGLQGEPAALNDPAARDCPFVLWHPERGWLLAISRSAAGTWLVQDASGGNTPLDDLSGLECTSLPVRTEANESALSAAQLVWSALLKRKLVFSQALIATVLANLLALVASIYSMQVYDRVIPNQGYKTLWVLSVGAVLALMLELVLKHVRSEAVERTATRIDSELSDWFFLRALGIRLECRPPAVGTLAAQIKGFELVRGVLSSTSIFMLVDVPFALFFIAVIAAVGGWMVVVPLVLLPISLISGLMFQRQIARHARLNQGQSNRKAGLLVESIDGAECLKANSAEWKLQSRWGRLVEEAGESDYHIKHYSSLSQHLTVSLQQVGYIGLVSLGAWLVAENHLTMGALIACTIINGRALSPIAQLSGLMVQWEHARAAIAGLDKLIALPNEMDERAGALMPKDLDWGLRFEQVRFGYGMNSEPALDIGRLEIKAGERVAIVGAIGSSKSTLLKIASGLYRPGQGKLFMGGIDLSLIDTGIVREAIGYMSQDIRLVSGTLRENLLLGLPDPGDDAVLEAARQSGLIDLIASHPKGLALPITEGGRGISGGQKQLVGLTRLLLADPKVLVLDEPTASMDASAEARVVAVLRAKAAQGRTLIVATHKSALLAIVDRMLVTQSGRLIIDGPRDLVLAKLSGAQPVVAPLRRIQPETAMA